MKIIETEIYYLTPEEGGRQSGVFDGYRGQFHYNGVDCEGFQYFPENKLVKPGSTVKAMIHFPSERWEMNHSKHLDVGSAFEIKEGGRIVGIGIIVNLDPEVQ